MLVLLIGIEAVAGGVVSCRNDPWCETTPTTEPLKPLHTLRRPEALRPATPLPSTRPQLDERSISTKSQFCIAACVLLASAIAVAKNPAMVYVRSTP